MENDSSEMSVYVGGGVSKTNGWKDWPLVVGPPITLPMITKSGKGTVYENIHVCQTHRFLIKAVTINGDIAMCHIN